MPYVEVVKKKFGKVNTIMEAFSGPGFIGFALLANDLCDKLILTDINPDAIKCCLKTIEKSGANRQISSKVDCYVSDCLDKIPKMKVDLIIGNPPHKWTASEEVYHQNIKLFDPNMRIHKKFYKQAPSFLKPNGSILLWENFRATQPGDFQEMFNENGLRMVDSFKNRKFSWRRWLMRENPYHESKEYFIHSMLV